MDNPKQNNQNRRELLIKIGLFVFAVVLLVIVLPKEGKFRYEFAKGKPWLHDDLYAPFDFAIIKFDEEIKAEQEQTLKNLRPYFTLDTLVASSQAQLFINTFENGWKERYGSGNALYQQKEHLINTGLAILDSLFGKGII